MQCKHIKSDGTTCKGFAVKDSNFCFFHTSETQEKHLEAAKQGGKATYNRDSVKLNPIPVEDALSTAYLITDTINRVRITKPDGTMDLKVANSIGFLSSRLLECKKLMLYEENLLKDSICKDKKVDLATFRKLMQEYDQELDDTAGAVLEDARQRYEEHKKHKEGYLF